jgi:hypothetical protein
MTAADSVWQSRRPRRTRPCSQPGELRWRPLPRGADLPSPVRARSLWFLSMAVFIALYMHLPVNDICSSSTSVHVTARGSQGKASSGGESCLQGPLAPRSDRCTGAKRKWLAQYKVARACWRWLCTWRDRHCANDVAQLEAAFLRQLAAIAEASTRRDLEQRQQDVDLMENFFQLVVAEFLSLCLQRREHCSELRGSGF